jgi:hypothetical protein
LDTNSVKIQDLVQEAANDQFILEEMRETVLVCLYGLLTGKVVDLPPDIANWHVSTEDLGKTIKWFGSLREGMEEGQGRRRGEKEREERNRVGLSPWPPDREGGGPASRYC